MAPRSRRTDDEVVVAGDLEQPVKLYAEDGRSFDVFTQRELTRYRSWGYSTEAPSEPVDQPTDPGTPT